MKSNEVSQSCVRLVCEVWRAFIHSWTTFRVGRWGADFLPRRGALGEAHWVKGVNEGARGTISSSQVNKVYTAIDKLKFVFRKLSLSLFFFFF